MCSILFFSSVNPDISLSTSDHFHCLRGPDATRAISVNGRLIIHNLLSLNGSYALQPIFIESLNSLLFFNGEIYNKEIHGCYRGNDTSYLGDLFENCSSIEAAINEIDGEFVICLYDIARDTIAIASDLFRTKPLWVGFSACDNTWAVSTYKSGFAKLTDPRYVELPPNKIIVMDLSSGCILKNKTAQKLEISQAVKDFEEWCHLFDLALIKRKPRVGKLLIPVSSGFDSGLLAYRSRFLGLDPLFLSIPGCEDTQVMLKRQEDLGVEFLSLTPADYSKALQWITENVEDYSYKKHQPLLDVPSLFADPGAVGLYCVLEYARRLGCKVSFSGQGADEIYSDYGYQGKPLANVSTFAGNFPDKINEIFPWKNLFSGTQRAYLMKDEHVAGSMGMEARYPFLDRELFSCFLALPSTIKNSTYKGPIGRWVSELDIPVANQKLGFSANKNLI